MQLMKDKLGLKNKKTFKITSYITSKAVLIITGHTERPKYTRIVFILALDHFTVMFTKACLKQLVLMLTS